MEDLLENFSKHINKVISSKLGSKIRNLARATTNYRTDEDYSRMESNIQMLIESYLSLKDNEYKEIANNIFNSFIEEDDKNLIKAINFFKRTYEYYQELNLRKKFFKWRKTSLKLKMINNLVSKEMKSKKENNNNIINKNKIQLNEIRYNDNNDDKEENNNINMENSNINKGNNFENVEEFINNGNNSQSYKFNYGEYMDNNEDFKEEFNEELDVNKLYSKKKYNN